ncbi:MAG: RsmE family RNA methyltransferase [candidate division SR1 bacterium]|nr:RsmE family RNA methyltransferase [candidate division SR1 bacterium]
MQLFVTEYQKKDKNIIITNDELLSQLRKVLRARIGDIIRIQSPDIESTKIRYELSIDVWDNKIIEGTIVSEQNHTGSHEQKSMIIAMPNKRDKIEMIVQKLTECGLDQIIFWPSERSIIKEWNPKKEERLHKIIKEATEQSRGRNIPNLKFTTDITKYLQDTELVVFDKSGMSNKGQKTKTESKIQDLSSKIGLIGPEGGLTSKDYQIFEGTNYATYELGETVLRTETAAIIGGRLIKNNFNS